MNKKRTVRICTLAVAVLLLAYILLAAVLYRPAADARLFETLTVEIKDSTDHPLVAAAEIRQLLRDGGIDLKGKTRSEVMLDSIERLAERHSLVREAQCCMLPSGKVRLAVWQRVPVLRVLPSSGERFFLDGDGQVIHISRRHGVVYPMDIPVVTGRVSERDTLQLEALFHLTHFLQENEWWRHMVQELEVDAVGRWIIHPAEGNFEICLGRPEDLPFKFGALRSFYREVYPLTGPDYYARLNLEFKDQLLAVKRKPSK